MDELIQNIKEAVTLHFEDDILSSVSVCTGIAKDDLIDRPELAVRVLHTAYGLDAEVAG